MRRGLVVLGQFVVEAKPGRVRVGQQGGEGQRLGTFQADNGTVRAAVDRKGVFGRGVIRGAVRVEGDQYGLIGGIVAINKLLAAAV